MRGTTSDTGSIIQNSDYPALRPPSPQQPAATDPDFGFTGHLKCPFTGLTLAPYRVLGYANWLSRDPIGEEGGINLYSYVSNSPANLIDPFGLCPDLDALLGRVESGFTTLGLIPGLEFFDAASGLLSLARGDYLGASLSLGAMLPFGGMAPGAAKLGLQAAKSAASAERLVIGRGADLAKPGALGPGEFKLSWPPTGAVRPEWKVNSGLLRQEMRNMRPIRDASIGDTRGVYLNAERNLLESRGWQLDKSASLWMPPAP